ncbi:MAG: FtsX-like permease family protein [Flavonifractor sp.]|nr:FtsX-like permease family protein [Flavonifractor sp.]MCI9474321.1 FtsX-like permease family protein [Flavonifractor sp.]
MSFRQAFKMAVKSIVGKKMRSFLTMLGIIIGVAAVVIMVSVIQGQNQQWMKYILSQGTNRLSVEAYSWNGTNISDELSKYCMGLGDLVEGITPSSLQINQTVNIKYGSKVFSTDNWDDWTKRITVELGSEQYGLCNNYTIAEGRDMSHLEIEKANNVCVLGGGAAEMIFDFVNPIGKTITLNSTPFQVVGVYEKKGVDGWPEWDNIILIPYTFNRSMNGNQPIQSYTIKAVDAEASTRASTLIQGFLKGLIPEDNGWYNVQNSNQSIDNVNEQNLMQSLVVGCIAGVSLLVGGIGIMNIMLVTVTERTREIGIRKAIGAERKSIIIQFLIEACMLCGLGGIIGIFFGYLGTLIAGKFMLQMILYPTMSITIGAFAFSVVLGVVFGIYPAIKASGLQPVVALRAD